MGIGANLMACDLDLELRSQLTVNEFELLGFGLPESNSEGTNHVKLLGVGDS